MPDSIQMFVDGAPITVSSACTVASAIAIAGRNCRTSVSGEPRGPLCGMGICFECRAMVNGKQHTRTCLILCEPAMEVVTT